MTAPMRFLDAAFLACIPHELGELHLQTIRGRVVAHTDAGVTYLIPSIEVHPHKAARCELPSDCGDFEPDGVA